MQENIFYKYNNLDPATEWSMDKLLEYLPHKGENFLNAAKYISSLKKEHNLIIYTDYDTDGLTSGLILKESLQDFFKEIIVFSNDKHKDSYNTEYYKIEETLKSFKDTSLDAVLITADTGITDVNTFENVSKNKKIIKSIILDHHENNGQLPKADFIIDFKINEDVKEDIEYCTASLAWIFSYQIHQNMKKMAKLLPIAAIAVVGDMVPLKYGNYAILASGMKMINSNFDYKFRKFIDAMKEKSNSYTKEVYTVEASTELFGFGIVPALNSSTRVTGRTDSAILAVENAGLHLLKLKEINEKRKLYKKILAQGLKVIYKDDNLNVIKVDRDAFFENTKAESLYSEKELLEIEEAFAHSDGIVGILAGDANQSKDASKVQWVLQDKKGGISGSLRAKKGISIIDAFDVVKKQYDILAGGGHAGAAGFAIKDTDEKIWEEIFQSISKELESQVPSEDTLFELKDFTKEYANWLMDIEPIFGMSRKLPAFKIPKKEIKITAESDFHLKKKGLVPKYSKSGNLYINSIVKVNDVYVTLTVYQQDFTAGFNIDDDIWELVPTVTFNETGKILTLKPREV